MPHALSYSAASRQLVALHSGGSMTAYDMGDLTAPLRSRHEVDVVVNVTTSVVTQDQSMMALALEGSVAILWMGNSTRPATLLHMSGIKVTALSWSPGGELLAVGGADGLVRIWYYDGRRGDFGADPSAELPRAASAMSCLAFSDRLGNSSMLASGTAEGIVTTYDLHLDPYSGALSVGSTSKVGTSSFFRGVGAVTAMAFSPAHLSSLR